LGKQTQGRPDLVYVGMSWRRGKCWGAERCCMHDVRFDTCRCVKKRLRPGFRPVPQWRADP